jgi:hypothetical protein
MRRKLKIVKAIIGHCCKTGIFTGTDTPRLLLEIFKSKASSVIKMEEAGCVKAKIAFYSPP